MAKRSSPPPSLGLVLIRVMTGFLCMGSGWEWVTTGSVDGILVLDYVRAATETQPSWVAWYGDSLLLSNPDAFAFFWRWAALLLGCALFCGALTRPAGILAAVFLLHGAAFGPAEAALVFKILALTAFSCAVSGAGRRVGLDIILDEECPSWLTWTKSRKSAGLFP